MATSNTTTFTLDIDGVCAEAIELVGGEPTLGNDIRSARRALNLLLREWENRNIPLWKLQQITVSCVVSTQTYLLSTNTVDVLDMIYQRSSTDLAMERISFAEWLNIPRKGQLGRSTRFFVDRQRDQPTAYLWPIPDTSTDTFTYWAFQRIQDATSPTQTVDMPFRFLPVLPPGVAYYMSLRRKGIPTERVAMLKAHYEEQLDFAMQNDRERASLHLVPRLRLV